MAKFTFDFDIDGIMQDIESEIMDAANEKLETKGADSVFHKLPSNSEKLLDEMLYSDSPTEMLANRFYEYEEQQQFTKEDELRSILGELEELHYIKVTWGNDVPDFIWFFNSARTYHEQLEEYNRRLCKTKILHK